MASKLPWSQDGGLRNLGKQQEHIYRKQIRDVDHLVERFVEEWSGFDHASPVLQLLNDWHARLRRRVKADRGHFEDYDKID